MKRRTLKSGGQLPSSAPEGRAAYEMLLSID